MFANKKLDKIKSLLSHKHPHLTDSELLNELADIALKKLDPTMIQEKAKTKTASMTGAQGYRDPALPAPEVKSDSE